MRHRRRVFSRGSVLYIRFRDADGKLVRKAADTDDRRKAEELAIELEAKFKRQRDGLDPLPPKDGGGTLWALVGKWLATLEGKPSHRGIGSTLRTHLLPHPIAQRTLTKLRPGHVAEFLASIKRNPQTVKHVRGFLNRSFKLAAEREWWLGPNPVAATKAPEVSKSKVGDFLRLDEIPRVLAALAPENRAKLGVSLYCGLRKGELFALQKRDVDLENRLLKVGRSWDRDITKNGEQAFIPIHSEAVPWFEQALKESPKESLLLFPGSDGKMRPRDVKLAELLRRAMVRAGIVDHWVHACRKHGCDHEEEAPEAEPRRCPKHNVILWAKAVARPIRWHDTRHSTATLYLRAGAKLAVVQRLMRHADPKMTERYAHLEADWLREEIDRLKIPAQVNQHRSNTAHETATNSDQEAEELPGAAMVEEVRPRSSTG